MPDYWEDGYNGAFPPSRTMIAGPSEIVSYQKNVSLSVAAIQYYDDETDLTDGSAQDVVKLLGAGTFLLDLGAATPINVIAMVNHNFPSVRIRVSEYTNLQTPVVDETFVPAPRVGFLDLREIISSGYRYVGVTPSNTDAIVGELVAANAVLFDGPMIDVGGSVFSPQTFHNTPRGAVEVVRSGVLHRSISAGFRLASDTETFRELMVECSLAGRNFLLVPDSRVQEAYWVDWVEQYTLRHPSHVTPEFESFTFTEEAFSVIQ
jgi:hypothetical protein